jgi:hypothetical protein
MGMPKWMKKDRERWLENERLHPTPAPIPEIHPFTETDKKKFERAAAIINEVIHGMSRDERLIRELVSLGHDCLPSHSFRHLELQSKIKHYATLHQQAARDALWRKMYDIIYGLQTELHLSRNRRDRGGTNIQ